MISYIKSLLIILNISQKKFKFLTYKKRNIINSFGFISFDNIYSNKNIPHFNNSAMDGYAIFLNSFDKATNNNFNIVNKIRTGDLIELENFKQADAVEITTGSRLPSNLNLVIKVEDTIKTFDGFYVKKKFKIFENIKFVGEDFKIGDKIINKGDFINSNKMLALSTVGKKKINTIIYPKFFLISTGNEITDQSFNLNSVKIPNSSAFYIISFFKSLNIKVKYLGITKDLLKNFINKIKFIWNYKKISVFVTTGAISKGISDFIPNLLKYIGINILFKSVNIKPGKPIIFANFKFNIYFFCLPGNPISSIIGIRFFLFNFLMSILGQNLEDPIKIIKINNNTINFKKDTFLKTYFNFKNSALNIKILDNQESFKVKVLLETNSFTLIKSFNNKLFKNYNIYLNNFFYFF